jgi:putative transposase
MRWRLPRRVPLQYVERNAVRAGLVGRAEYWEWSSLWRLLRENEKSSEILSQWPMERPKEWIQFVNEREQESELEDMRSSAQRGRPYGSEDWMIKIAKQLGLGSTMNLRGRPKRS